MKLRSFAIGVAVGLSCALAWVYAVPVSAQLGLSIRPEALTYRMVGDEPIATPDGRSVITGWKAIMVRDIRSEQCFTVFLVGGASASAVGPVACPGAP